nr:replication protein A 70 kDa DNA-binding subunit B-like [Ipomoea batatas]
MELMEKLRPFFNDTHTLELMMLARKYKKVDIYVEHGIDEPEVVPYSELAPQLASNVNQSQGDSNRGVVTQPEQGGITVEEENEGNPSVDLEEKNEGNEYDDEENNDDELDEDLIGRVVSITEPKVIQVNSNPQRLIDFVIEDSRSTDHYTTSVYNQDCEVRISSSYIATKILFNYECPEFPNFNESMPKFLTPIRSISSSSRITGSRSLEALSSENVTITSLKDIYNKMVGEFWVLWIGEILGIEGEWYFSAYNSKGVERSFKTMHTKCTDDHLLLWDNVCSTRLEVTICELKEKYSEDGCMPNEIENLIEIEDNDVSDCHTEGPI